MNSMHYLEIDDLEIDDLDIDDLYNMYKMVLNGCQNTHDIYYTLYTGFYI